ncbi:MAG: Ig-like domain-containing protein [Bacteroides sp.]|nr:Ig-like domain-containing protein [Bacteroides sp.]
MVEAAKTITGKDDEEEALANCKSVFSSGSVPGLILVSAELTDPIDKDNPKTPISATIDEMTIELAENGSWNWQGEGDFSVKDFAPETLGDFNVSNMTVEFNATGAKSDGKAFDLSKISYQIRIKTTDWLVMGSSTYDADTGKVIVTADVSAAIKNFSPTDKTADKNTFPFNGFSLVAGTSSLDDATAPITLTIGGKKDVPVTGITLNKTELALVKGDTAALTATVAPETATDSTVVWSSSDTDVVTVDEEGTVTAIGAGTATVTAASKSTPAVKAICEVAVTVPVTGVTLNKTELALKKGETETLTATVAPTDASDKTLDWASSDSTVATVDSTGKVTAVASGTATITVKSNADETKKATCTVTVTNPATAIALSDMTVLVGEDKTIALALTPEDADEPTVVYTSSDPTIFTVANGKVTGVAAGEATLTATAGELTASCKVTVSAEAIPATKVELNKTTLELEVGGTAALTATLTPADSTDTLVWSSSVPATATVDQTGKVTAVAEGTTVITVKANDGVSASCTVTVSAKTIAITEVVLDKTTASVEEGETVQLTATVKPEDTTEDKTVTWESSDGTVATVDSTGKVTAVKAGTATITAKAGTKTAECVITVTEKQVTTTEEPVEIVTGTEEASAPVDPDEGVVIEVEGLDVALEAEPDTFEEGVTEVKAEVKVDTTVAPAKEESVSAAVEAILEGTEDAENAVEISAVISVVLKDQNGDEIQPVEGGSVKVTVPYDGKSNYAAYVDGDTPEFIKLVIDAAKKYASFDAKHFSDYYLVALSEKAAEAVDKENGEDVEKEEKTFEGSLVINDTAWWTSKNITLEELIGEFDPDDVKSVAFTCAGHGIQVGYNGTSGWTQHELAAGETKVCTDIVLKPTPVPTEENPDNVSEYTLFVGISAGDGVDYTVSWVTTAEVEKTEDDNPGGGDDQPTTTAVLLSEEEKAMDNWGTWVEIAPEKFAEINSAGKIVVTIKDTAAGAQYGFRYGDSWTNYILPNGFDYSEAMTAGQTSYEVEISADFLATLKQNKLIITGHDYTIVKVEYVATSTGGTKPPVGGDDDETETAAPTPTPGGSSFTSPPVSGGSTSSSDNTTTAPALTTAPSAEPAVTDAPVAGSATETVATDHAASAADPDNGGAEGGAAPSDGGDSNVGNAGAGTAEDKNAATGVALALVPAIAAAAGVIISKKRK